MQSESGTPPLPWHLIVSSVTAKSQASPWRRRWEGWGLLHFSAWRKSLPVQFHSFSLSIQQVVQSQNWFRPSFFCLFILLPFWIFLFSIHSSFIDFSSSVFSPCVYLVPFLTCLVGHLAYYFISFLISILWVLISLSVPLLFHLSQVLKCSVLYVYFFWAM